MFGWLLGNSSHQADISESDMNRIHRAKSKQRGWTALYIPHGFFESMTEHEIIHWEQTSISNCEGEVTCPVGILESGDLYLFENRNHALRVEAAGKKKGFTIID
jgi:hypothetical protein